MVRTVYELDTLPSALRFPRGSALGVKKLNELFGYGLETIPAVGKALPIGKGRIVREAKRFLFCRCPRPCMLAAPLANTCAD